MVFKKLLGSVIIGAGVIICSISVIAQTSVQDFKNAQFASSRVSDAWKKYNDTLAATFKRKNVEYPCKDICLRAFKSQNEMELWGRNNEGSEYKLIKIFHICAISGSLGPKRGQGDNQVPEGYYFIDEFNPRSDYYLAMLLNYPNFSDRLMSRKPRLGGDIYIHGGCVTIGCMPMTDEGIKEIYTACLSARLNGQANIPVHIYPTHLNKSGMAYLTRSFASDHEKQQFWTEMKGEYDYFEKYHKLLPVMYTPEGNYAN